MASPLSELHEEGAERVAGCHAEQRPEDVKSALSLSIEIAQ
jgi:hypothetical protein